MPWAMRDETGGGVNDETDEHQANKHTIVVKIEKNCQKEGEGNSEEDISNINVPKVH